MRHCIKDLVEREINLNRVIPLVESVWKRFWENEENNVKRVVGPLWKKIIFASDIIIGLQIL